MIVPSIDLANGQAVQLVGGMEPRIEAGDPRPIAERFRLAGEIAVIDLDAARGTGHNRTLIEELVRMAPCRVGGGIRDLDTARHWLDAGARRIILGTAATPEILSHLPRQRVIVALDALHDEVVTHGWTTRSGETVEAGMARLRDLAGGFLVTFVEREGRMEGTDLDRALALARAAGDARLTVAGGFTDPREIATADRAGIDAQVGMALYSGALHLADAIAAPLVSDRPDGLWPTVVVDEHQRALGLAWSDAESLRAAVDRKAGVYHSRTRGLWIKGETSGATQDLLRIDPDCDRDALKFTVRQAGSGFCHLGTRTCWGDDAGLPALVRVLAGRLVDAPAGSYTARLFSEPAVLEAKLLEEARELAAAETRADVIHEAADVIFFALTAAVRAGVDLADIEGELDRRALAITRRSAT